MRLLHRRMGRRKGNHLLSPRRSTRIAWRRVAASVVIGGLFLAMGLAAPLIWKWVVFPITTVEVYGDLRYADLARLRELLAEQAVGGFFRVDIARIRHSLESQPWIRRASVRRVWPDTLRAEVVEQVPVARWGEEAAVNSFHEVFSPPRDSIPTELPHWQGPAGSQKELAERYRDMSALLAPLGLRVMDLALDERRAWQLKLDNGIDLRLGRKRELQRLESFVRIYPAVLAAQTKRIAVVDLRYKNGFAVRWRPSTPAGERIQKA